MKKPTTLDTLLLVQRELRQFHANDKDSQALVELEKLVKSYKKSTPTKLLITVEGGVVQGVMTTDKKSVRVVVVDYDKHSDEPVVVSAQPLEKLKAENYYEIFTDQTDPVEMQVRDELKRLKF